MKRITLIWINLLIITLLHFGCGGVLFANSVFFTICDVNPTTNVSFNNPKDTLPKTKKERKIREKRSKKNKVTFETFDYNFDRALKFYNNGQYLSAAKVLEELYPLSLGTPMADSLLFMFADCYYKNRDYEMAAFHFKDYARRYPRSERAELAYVMSVKAVYHISPYYALDQTETVYAIEELNTFITLYPNSQYMDECNEMLDILRNKLAKKDFEVVKLYFHTENYKATQIAIKNFLKSHASSPYADEVSFLLVKNNFIFAKKSIEKKKMERYRDCMEAFQAFKINYPQSSFLKEAQKYAEDASKQIEKIENKNNT